MSQGSDQTRSIRRTVTVLVSVMVLFVGGFFYKISQPRILNNVDLATNGAIVFNKGRIIPDFELINHDGEPFTLDSMRGQWTLVYFGFTSCPDICPTTFATLSQVYSKLDAKIKEQVQIVLITVDPARDTEDKLKLYMNHFHSDFVGVTGDFIAIRKLTDKLNVAFSKVVTGDDYTVDHSGHLVLINPYGHYHGIFKPPFSLARLKLTLQSIVASFDYP